MHVHTKLTSKMCQEVGRLDGKTMQNGLKLPTLPLFSQKPAAFIEKR